jgi:penicillin G amidase
MRVLPVLFPILLVTGCHPLACFHPADLPRDQPLVLVSNDAFPKEDVEIHVDTFGIPHIWGKSEADLSYGLGAMMGRDRLFQMMLLLHAGSGRLTELLGADYLEVDRANRLLMTGADEQLAALTQKDRDILEAFVAGVNESAKMVGKSAEMQILGVDWEPMTPRDVLAIARYQQWDQGVGFSEEMARWRLVKQLGEDSPVLRDLLVDSPSGGVPVVDVNEHDGEPFVDVAARTALHAPPPAHTSVGPHHSVVGARVDPLRAAKEEIAEMFRDGGKGASNSWSVDAAHTEKGVAVVSNDPHLGHSAPGIFYMVDMHLVDADGNEHVVAGGAFPGIPAVLIGHGNDIAWGITNAYADTQDVLVLQVPPGQDNTYVVDGTTYQFGTQVQKFKLGKGDDAKVLEETYLTSIFGPVLPPGYGSYGQETALVDDGEKLALMWTAIDPQYREDNARFIQSFWNLALSKNIDDAHAALQDFTAPAMNVNMAFTDGTIAYRLNGIIPVRGDNQRVDFPRLGTTPEAGWIGRLPAAQKPQLTNPPKGYINATNQRIVENDILSQRFVGFESAKPWRAMRVDARVKELIANGKKANTEDILAVQRDNVGLDAQELAPIFGAHCKGPIDGHDEARVTAFCKAVGDFGGVYTVDATAIPYARLQREFHLEVLRAHVHPDLADDLAGQTFAGMAMHELIKKEHAGEIESPLFDDPKTDAREGLDGFTKRALKIALDAVVADAGGGEGDWRWGKLHTLSLRGPLSSAPVIGGLFATSARETPGTSSVPNAEGSDFNNKMRVRFGSGLRLVAEMTSPPTIRIVNDSGQSGHFGHRHLEDQNPLWHEFAPRVVSANKADAEANREGAMVIKPKR